LRLQLCIPAKLPISRLCIVAAKPNYTYFWYIKLEEMETMISSLVTFTQQARKEIRRLTDESGFDPKTCLRIGVKGGGCSGLTYILGFDQKMENDEQYDFEGLSFVMNPAHGIYLMGMEIDWQDGLNARGFTFKNPNASKTCGCGTSFAV
jgi:iron-sulfur cluster assembly accessory protein